MHKSLRWLLLGMLIGLMGIVILNPHNRLKEENNTLYEAVHVQLPGFVESYSPEHIIELKDWTGSSIEGITVEENGVRNPELEAEPFLRVIGWATKDYVRESTADGHYILRKPAQTFRYFSWRAYYRVSPWVLYKEN